MDPAGADARRYVYGNPELLHMDWATIPAEFQLGVQYAGVFAIVVGFLNGNQGVRVIGQSHIFVCQNLLTDFDVAGAWLRRYELAHARQPIGTGFIL